MLNLSCLRHGETKLLAQGVVLRGQLDDPLTTLGWLQMQTAFDAAFAWADWQVIVSSPLSRCLSFAQLMADKHDLPLVVVEELGEMNFGVWEGYALADLQKNFANELALWWQMPTAFVPERGERVVDFAARIDLALAKLATLAQADNYHRMCVVTHGGVIKYLYCLAKQLPLDSILQQPANLGEFHHFQYANHQLTIKT